MATRTYSTRDAAGLLKTTEMTIRRWAKSGRLPATRSGKSWAIDAEHIDRMIGAASSRSRVIDLRRAVRKTITGRRLNEWLPDGLHYRDVVWDGSRLERSVQRRWDTGDLEGQQLEHIAVAKGASAFRPGALLRLSDETLYTALVLAASKSIEAKLGAEVFSYRVAHPNDEGLMKPQGPAWEKFQEAQRPPATDGWSDTLITDVSGFYEYIDVEYLTQVLLDLGVDPSVANALKGLLKGWQKKSGLRGLPQGPDASAVLANAYLIPVDEAMRAECTRRGWRYLRWSDDIRVLTPSRDDARMAAFILSGAMRRRGLYLGPAKTEFVTTRALADRASATELGWIAYLFDERKYDEVRSEIWPVFRRATRNLRTLELSQVTEIRFCLYRLGKIKDRRALGVVLRELPDSGFLGVHVYLYLREFVSRPDVVHRVRDVISALDPFRDAHLVGNLVRVLAEAPTLGVEDLNVLRDVAWRKPAPDAVRAVAFRAVGLHGASADEAELLTRLWREADHRVIRSILAAIRDLAPTRASSILGDYRRANPEYDGVVEFLRRFGAPRIRP